MSNAATLILSPHLDDAVLSCWHLLSGPGEVWVVNVFSAVPDSDGGSRWWDLRSGAGDSAARMEERRAEDAAALALAGRAAEGLDFLDEQYRDEPQPVEPLVERLRAQLEPGTLVYAPAALGATGDHAAVRAAGLMLDRDGWEVRLYADLPHAIRDGWFAWVNGGGWGPGTYAPWDERFRGAGLDPGTLTGTVHRLEGDLLRRKLDAVRTYRTQIAPLEAAFVPLDQTSLGHEVTWRLPGRVEARPR